MLASIFDFILATIEQSGYIGLFIFMAIESSFLPLPSEVVMIPAGYLVWQGKMDFFPAIVAGGLGSLVGALCNYFLACKIGRALVIRYGRYFFMKEKHLKATEAFFAKHGEISTFVGRLLPVIRQYISLPAGLARMSLFRFCIFTLLGAGIWVSALTIFGWWLGGFLGELDLAEIAKAFGGGERGELQNLIREKLHYLLAGILVLLVLVVLVYRFFLRAKKRRG